MQLNFISISIILLFHLHIAVTAQASSKSPANTLSELTMTEIDMTEVDLAVPEVSPRPRYSPWGLSYFNWATQDLAKTEEGRARLNTYNYLSINYRLNGGMFSIRPTFFVNGSGYDDYDRKIVKSEVDLGDIYLQYSKYNIALLPGDIGLTGAIRVYLPQGDYAKRQGKISELRGKLYFSKPWGYGWNTTYMIEPRYSFFTERGYLTEYGNSAANRYAVIWHYIEQAKLFNDRYGISAQVGMKHNYYYDFESEGIQNRIEEDFETAFYFLFNIDGVSIKAGLMQAHNVRRPNSKYEPGGDFKLFNNEETQISIMTSFRL
ncbi:MAG: hypothetical protein H6625_01185 [Bdellovibrionaceae bacterium]|nr:hypothetical protein [Pseudobdellovibrionaceae bacterium]